MTLTTLKLVYKNMIAGRSKLALFGLIALGLYCTTNMFLGLLKFGSVLASVFAVISLGLWFFALPCVFTLIDIKVNPKRIDKISTR